MADGPFFICTLYLFVFMHLINLSHIRLYIGSALNMLRADTAEGPRHTWVIPGVGNINYGRC